MLNKKERVWRHKYKFITLKCINSISKSMAANFKSFYRTLFPPWKLYVMFWTINQQFYSNKLFYSYTNNLRSI